MKDKLDGTIMIKFVALGLETYSYLTDYYDGNKKSKRHKKVSNKTKT